MALFPLQDRRGYGGNEFTHVLLFVQCLPKPSAVALTKPRGEERAPLPAFFESTHGDSSRSPYTDSLLAFGERRPRAGQVPATRLKSPSSYHRYFFLLVGIPQRATARRRVRRSPPRGIVLRFSKFGILCPLSPMLPVGFSPRNHPFRSAVTGSSL